MHIWQAIILGIVEGLTEFLPVSVHRPSEIVEGLLGIDLSDPGVTAFTAIIQVGAIAAVIIYFRQRHRADFIMGFVRGLTSAEARQAHDWRMALYVIVGSIPIGRGRAGAQERDRERRCAACGWSPSR